MVAIGRSRSTPAAAKRRAQLVLRQQGAVGADQLEMGQAQAARDVAAAQPLARLRLGAGEAAARAGVDHLLAPAQQIGAHLLQLAHQKMVLARGEVRLARDHRLVGQAVAPRRATSPGRRPEPPRRGDRTPGTSTMRARSRSTCCCRRPRSGCRRRGRAGARGWRTSPDPAACGAGGSRRRRPRRCRSTPRLECAPRHIRAWRRARWSAGTRWRPPP